MPSARPPIVLIHGLWMTPRSWEGWAERFRAAGHEVHAPSWPGMEAEVEELNRDPSPIAGITIGAILDHHEAIVRGLDEPPILMGHSFGGAFVLALLDRGVGLVGVGIDAAPPKGILGLPVSTLRSAFPVLKNPANRTRAVPITAKEFRYAFGNTSSEEASQAAYERYAVPAAGHVLFEGGLANVSPHSALAVDFEKADRAPLLLLAGGEDHVVPASTTRAIARHYAKGPATVEVREWPERSHFTVGEPGWEAVADHALAWALEHASTGATA